MNKYPWEKYIAILILILGSLYVIWAVQPIWQKRWLNDDSFITLTYAKNLVEGKGFVYNHPPATLGTTSPLFALSTALLSSIFPNLDVVESAIILSVLPWIGASIGLYLIANHFNFHPLASAVVAIVPLTVVNSTWLWFIGMEIWLFQFLLVLSFYLSLTNHPLLAGLAVGLLFLTRGEGVLIGGILGMYFLLAHKRFPIGFVLAGLTVFSLWAVYAFFTFGAILPNTLAAKVAHREFLLHHGRDYSFLRVIGEAVPDWVKSFNLTPTLFSNIFLISILVGLLAIFFRKQYLWSFFLVWGAVYFVAYTLINPSTYPWYALHFYFIMEVMAGFGLGWFFDMAFNLRGIKRALVGSAACLLALFLLVPIYLRGIDNVHTFSGDNRAPIYMNIADWLNHNTQPQDTVAYIEVGYLGFYSQNRIIDLAGLIDPLIASHIAQDGFTWGFWHYQPKYLLFHTGMDSDAYLAGLRAAADQYKELNRFSGGSNDLSVILFQRIQ